MSLSSFPDTFDDSVHHLDSTHPFDDCTPPPYNNNFGESESGHDSFEDSAVSINSAVDDDVFGSNGAGFINFHGPVSYRCNHVRDKGFALLEWRKQNVLVLEQKEKSEKEILNQIIEEANEFKIAFHEKRKSTCEKKITDNREKEKLFLASHEQFHKEADKNYWRSIADLIPNEVPVIKKRVKKEDQKKPSVIVIQGQKPGKPTDLERMRQILVKLKHNTP